MGFCNKRREIRSFKLVRIKKVKLIKNQTFEKVEFNLKEYLDNNLGLISDGEYHIKLRIKYPYATGFKEFKWLEAEAIEDNKDKWYIIYTAKSRGFNDTINWIMGMGTNCEIIEPDIMKQELINKVNELIKMYSTNA